MEKSIDRSSNEPYYVQLKEIIENKIKNNEFPDGKLWSESEISKKYNLTIGTIRKSLFILKQSGKIYSVKGVGYFIKKLKVEFDLTKYLSIGRAIKEQGIDERIEVLKKEDSVVLGFLKDYDIRNKNNQSIKITRLRYIDNTPIDYEEIHLNKKIYGNIIEEAFDKVIYDLIVDKLKISIGGLEEFLEAGIPSKEERRLLKLDKNIPILILSRILKDTSGNWIEIAKFKIRSDMFRYHTRKNYL